MPLTTSVSPERVLGLSFLATSAVGTFASCSDQQQYQLAMLQICLLLHLAHLAPSFSRGVAIKIHRKPS